MREIIAGVEYDTEQSEKIFSGDMPSKGPQPAFIPDNIPHISDTLYMTRNRDFFILTVTHTFPRPGEKSQKKEAIEPLSDEGDIIEWLERRQAPESAYRQANIPIKDRGEPQYMRQQFSCLHCKAYAHQRWYKQTIGMEDDRFNELGYGNMSLIFNNQKISASICASCNQATLWEKTRVIFPITGLGVPVNDDVEDDVKQVYKEADSIARLSPRAACALLRVALEMLLKQITGCGAIQEAIKNLKQRNLLQDNFLQKFDILRVTGNHAVHPGTIDFQEKPQEDVKYFFQLFNRIAQHFITEEKEDREHFEKLPEYDRNHITKRNRQLES